MRRPPETPEIAALEARLAEIDRLKGALSCEAADILAAIRAARRLAKTRQNDEHQAEMRRRMAQARRNADEQKTRLAEIHAARPKPGQPPHHPAPAGIVRPLPSRHAPGIQPRAGR